MVTHWTNSQPLTLADLRGKVVLLRWWLNDDEQGWTSVSFLLDRQGIVRWVHPGGAYPPGSADYAELEETIVALLDEGE